ncbi:hypothetical protein [Desulfurobacterium sp.]|uniref:hypothetical protein n=1 Tax=Desulfurobacterium sp. TaxID=2004706 RepID=UPI002620359E|nr:hypothetical protein [Desulfurobacterium sp.]
MKKEKLVWWLFMIIFGIAIVAAAFGVAALISVAMSSPETAAFLVGLIGFWLFANRLIFGYGGVANAASTFLKGEKIDRETLMAKIKEPAEKIKEMSIASLLILWYNSLEPFKYAYYLGFFLVLTFAVILGMNIIVAGPVALVVKALTYGAAIPTLIVWGLELLSGYYIAEVIKKVAEDISK